MDRKPVSVKSYANIAIVKYWGKADADRMIPSTSSISLTLENMYTETKLSFLPKDATSDVMYIGDELQGEKETTKASKVLDSSVLIQISLSKSKHGTICQQQQAYHQVPQAFQLWSRPLTSSSK